METTLKAWLLDAPDAAMAVDRLAALADFQLQSVLVTDWDREYTLSDTKPNLWIGEITSKQRQSGGYYGYNRQTFAKKVRVSLGLMNQDPVIKGDCWCRADKCQHALQLIAQVIAMLRPDVKTLLCNSDEIAARTLSANAHYFLNLASTPIVEPHQSREIDSKKLLIYRMAVSPGQYCSTITLEGRSRLKNGSLSTRAQACSWRSLDEYAPPTGYGWDYGINAQRQKPVLTEFATSEDLKIAKLVYSQGGLPDSDHLPIQDKDMTDAIRAMCHVDRLYTDSDLPLRFGEPRVGSFKWVRSTDGGWQLSIDFGLPGIVVVTDPPMYLDSLAGTIGPLSGTFEKKALQLLAAGRSLSDRDVNVLQKCAAATSWGSQIPKLPEVTYVFGGKTRAKPTARFTWISVDDGHTPAGRSEGRAALLIKFVYEGLSPSEEKPGQLIKRVGSVISVYDIDETFEDECRKLVEVNGCVMKPQNNGLFVSPQGRLSDKKILATMHAYQNRVQPLIRAAGWNIEFGSDWPTQVIPLEGLDFSTHELGEGWFGFSLNSTIIGGQVINMMELLKRAFSDRAVMASIGKADDNATWELPAADGYAIGVPVIRLKKLLPFFLALTQDPQTGALKLRRIDFGVVQEAVNSGLDTIGGAQGLIDLSRKLSNISTTLPAATVDAMKLPARHYQAYGVNWCDARRQAGFGALIADEYAVGKTLQTLMTVFNAHGEIEATQKTSLLIVSKTLFFEGRWQEDARDFLPSMKLVELSGTRQVDRLDAVGHCHAILTTYDTILNNLERFQPFDWNVVACDEGHRINNSKTKAHKAIHGLKARQKLVVTGSPMQNTANEMWALMNMVAPGLLKDQSWFNRTFPKHKVMNSSLGALERDDEIRQENAARLQALGRIISPFVLRRTNKDVGRELPSVQVITRHIVLQQDQADLYEMLRATGSKEVRNLIAEKGVAKTKIEVLAQINRLRQACVDPGIIHVNGKQISKASSAKRDAVLELCQEFVAEHKRVVITSEWVTALEMVAKDLSIHGFRVASLNGRLTSGIKRKQVLDSFKSGEADVLLIQLSLAEGIELPEGDCIVILEPWWNRKREEQAIGRLRRDERQKHINVIRLVVPGSVEMGVMSVAQAKIDDIESVQSGQESGSSGLSLDEIDEFFKPLDGSARVGDDR